LYRAGHWRHLIPGTSATITLRSATIILSPAPGPRAAPVERLALIALIALAAGIVSVVGLVALVARGSRRRSRDRS
jgi:hypothetical protein